MKKSAWRYLRWALDTDLSRQERYVLIELADRANKDGLTWPGVKYLAHKTKYHQSKVREALTNLIKWGYIEVVSLSKRGQPTRYRLTLKSDERHIGAPIEMDERHIGAPIEMDERHIGAPIENNGGHIGSNGGHIGSPNDKGTRARFERPMNVYKDRKTEECVYLELDPSSEIPREAEPDEDTHTQEAPPSSALQRYRDKRSLIGEIIQRVEALSEIRYPVDWSIENRIEACVHQYGAEATLAYPQWVANPISGLPFWDRQGRRTEDWDLVTEPGSLFKTELVRKRLPRVLHWLENGQPERQPQLQSKMDAIRQAFEARKAQRASIDADYQDIGDQPHESPRPRPVLQPVPRPAPLPAPQPGRDAGRRHQTG